MSFIGDEINVRRLSAGQKAVLEIVGAAFAALELIGGKELAGDLELGFRITKDIAKLTHSEKMHFHPRERGKSSFTVEIVETRAPYIGTATSDAPDAVPANDQMAQMASGPDEARPEWGLLATCCYWVWDPHKKQWVCKAVC